MSNEINKEEELKFSYFKPVGRLALIFFLGFSVYLFSSTMILIFLTKSSREVKVPDVLGKRYVDVSNSLVRRGFRTDLKFIDVYDMDDGVVLSQYPESGKVVSEDSSLRLTVSRSGFFIEVPSLVGSQLPIAVNKLKNMHYQDKSVSVSTGVVSYIPSEKTADNVVISQSPKPGTRITPDRKVNLLVSSGSVKDDRRMPSVTGQSIDLCYDLLLAKGLKVKEEIIKTGDIKKSGLVASQSIRKGALIKEGAPVKIGVYWYKLREHPYTSYEHIEYTIPSDQPAGLYEAYIEDNFSKRVRFSSTMSPGQKISFLYHRVGNSKIMINRDKNNIRIMSINVDEFE